MEKKKQESNVAHSLCGQHPTDSHLKSRSCLLSGGRPADFHPKVIRYNEWQHMLKRKTHSCSANLIESLARGHTSQRTIWRCINRLRAAKNSRRNGAIMKKILHATVVSHRRTPDICWNSRSLHIPSPSTAQRNSDSV